MTTWIVFLHTYGLLIFYDGVKENNTFAIFIGLVILVLSYVIGWLNNNKEERREHVQDLITEDLQSQLDSLYDYLVEHDESFKKQYEIVFTKEENNEDD